VGNDACAPADCQGSNCSILSVNELMLFFNYRLKYNNSNAKDGFWIPS
jgi:hypothetical protein